MARIATFLTLLFLSLPVYSQPWTQPYQTGLTQYRTVNIPRPKGTITRAEYAILIERTFLILPKVRHSRQFVDLPLSHWAYRPLLNAYEAGFFTGNDDRIFPDRPLTRLEVMVSLANGLQIPLLDSRTDRLRFLRSLYTDAERLPPHAIDPLAALAQHKVWLATPDNPYSLAADRHITGGEVAVLLYEVLAAQKQVPPISRRALPKVTRLEVSLSRRQVTAFQGNTKFKTYPIAVGRAGWETPQGTFKVQQMIAKPAWKNPFTGDVIKSGDPDNPLGEYWIGFWTNGKDWSGFHGTPHRHSVGQAISHGCLRMYNEHIKELFSLISADTIVKVTN
ncbi:MAG: L,D-transpeptidase family protein [Pseudanabaenaceae cyanobacterium SKYGB_i_bin29]|nr:L,D-transpeptidase family protein [Pseudanabaenaceae cyanobacterium SKYG29]MDW8421055.1 L,D-transpeptidase family protein [Pseudanabaenaceae cyanobacterium SKYGB_i_bin29]